MPGNVYYLQGSIFQISGQFRGKYKVDAKIERDWKRDQFDLGHSYTHVKP